jgi:hypothetical protein
MWWVYTWGGLIFGGLRYAKISLLRCLMYLLVFMRRQVKNSIRHYARKDDCAPVRQGLPAVPAQPVLILDLLDL